MGGGGGGGSMLQPALGQMPVTVGTPGAVAVPRGVCMSSPAQGRSLRPPGAEAPTAGEAAGGAACSGPRPWYPAAIPWQEPGAAPGPLVELDFWTERAANLNSIHEQLSSERVQKVVRVLELAKSTYHPPFVRLLEVGA